MAALVMALAVAVSAATGETTADDEANPGSPASQPLHELEGRRTATSNTFRLSDGTFETRIYQAPINFRDGHGKWQPIDQALEETASGAVANGDNSFDVHLPKDLDEAAFRVMFQNGWVAQAPLGIDTRPVEMEDGVASYSTQDGAADIEFEGLADGLKETIELAGPSAPSTYHFRLETSVGMMPTLEEDGSIELRGQNGDLVAEVPAPLMVDAAEAAAPTGAVKYALSPDGPSSWRLAVEADPAWLNTPERMWPVIIDPSVKVSQPASNCIIATDTSATMCGETGHSYLTAKAKYPSAGPDSFARTLLRFSMTSIPPRASITGASIKLYSAKTATNVTKVNLYDVNKGWTEAATWASTGATNWTTPGGDYGQNLPNPASVSTAQRGSQPGWWEFSSADLPWLVQRWKDGVVPNRGVLLKLADETPRVCCFERRVEWESSAATNKPYLAVDYIQAASSDSKLTSPTDGTKAAKRFVLTSAWDHSNVEGVKYQYRPAPPQPKAGETAVPIAPWSDIPAGQVVNGEKQTVTWPIGVAVDDRSTEPLYWDASGLAAANSSVRLQVRAVLSGSEGASGHTKPTEVELNRTTGGSKDAEASIGPGSVNLLTGNFSLSRTDVSIPGFGSSLLFSRSISSAEATTEATGVLGPGWQPSTPVEEAGGSAWQYLKIESKTEEFEGITETFRWAVLKHTDGKELIFDEDEKGAFVTPPEMSGYVVYRLNASEIALTDPGANRTVFSNNGSGNHYLPKSVAMPGGAGNKSRMIYEIEGGKRRLQMVIAPTAPGISCPDGTAWTTPGCRALEFVYEPANVWGAPSSAGMRLALITYYAPGLGGPWDVACYHYDKTGRLDAAWDPRVSPVLKETYGYGPAGQLATLTPPGLEPWNFQYGTGTDIARLLSVKRASLVPSSPTAQTTIAYGVPLTGPYDMSKQEIAKWGQEDFPMDATAIFPPDEVPSVPPSSYAHATVYYMDAEGQTVNVATPQGAGSSGPSISTMETDIYGNLSRELTAENRLRALAAGSGSAAKSRELDTQLKYSSDGTLLLDERGPVHAVRLESGAEAGTIVQARDYRSFQYDVGAPDPAPGVPMPQLTTHETTGALVAGNVLDQRTMKYEYDWDLRRKKATIVDPEGLGIKTVTKYDEETGQPAEVRQPKDAESAGAGTTRIVYYQAQTLITECKKVIYAGLPCKVEPAVQPASGPKLPITRFLSYSALGEPTEVVEETSGATPGTRKTLTTYDSAGRPTSKQIQGGGTQIKKVEMLYATATGAMTTQRFLCWPWETGCDSQSITVALDTLGRVTKYFDADGNEATTTYDLSGRPATFNDGKGTQAFGYDSATGLMVSLSDSMAGTFTASYDADGRVVEQGLPNGLTAETTFDAAGAPTDLVYRKGSNCGANCTWFDFEVARSTSGKILTESGTLGTNRYGYDRAGRLIKAEDEPSGGGCTTRAYGFDENSNRTSMATYGPGVGGACVSSGASPQLYNYDGADRLQAAGLNYDAFGRITTLPATYAGGASLETSYFSNDMVASQSQDGVTNTFALDAALRQRERTQAGGLQGIEVFHYANGSDSPAWTQLGETWTRNIVGIGGGLSAIAQSGKGPRLQITNLHGDVVATASVDPSESTFLLAPRADEFGKPVSGTPDRFGWLGGFQRRTELPSGVVQMGVRSYVPAMGRFLSVDPVVGGSANAYVYADGDPVNAYDLDGRQVLLPNPPFFVGACTFTVQAVDAASGYTHVISGSVAFRCNKLSTVAMWIRVPAARWKSNSNFPLVYNNVAGPGWRHATPVFTYGYDPWRNLPMQFCFTVWWEEGGEPRRKKDCTPLVPAKRVR